MAIIRCPECRKKISSDATVCPNCGCKPSVEYIWQQLAEPWYKKKPSPRRALISLVILFVLLHKSEISRYIEQGISKITGELAPAVIQQASEKDKQAAQAEINELRQYFRSKVDTVENIKWIHDKKTPENFQENTLYTYLGDRNGYTWPRVVIGFETLSKPVSMDRIAINIDGEIHYIEVDPAERQTEELSGGKTREYIDLKLTPEIEEIMWKIGNGKKVIVRFKGLQYHQEFTVSQAQKEALKHIWSYYKAKLVLGKL